jgi:2,4-dienoyl-CoA reductase-like NADH-dependent reductase (Old Yellow Enzyme family)
MFRDLTGFDRFIANPDLPAKLKAGLPLQRDDMATWLTQDAAGYLEVPSASWAENLITLLI